MKRSLFNSLTEMPDRALAGGSLLAGEGTALTPSTFAPQPGQSGGSLFAGEGTALTPSTFLPQPGLPAAHAAEDLGPLAPAAREERGTGEAQLSRAGHTARGTA